MAKYLWQSKDWPEFTWDSGEILGPLGRARKAQGMVISQAAWIGLETQATVIVEEAFTTSAIEGEKLDRDAIRSSVARRLGLSMRGLPAESRETDGLVEMLHDATSRYWEPLTAKRLNGWQAGLFPTGYSGTRKIEVGRWRTSMDPMRVVSGFGRREKVHYEAPPSSRVSKEMSRFLAWWKNPPVGMDGILRAAIAHFWFVAIHPYEDGNGRVARAITDMALAQDERAGVRLYSLSSQLIQERDQYYEVLEQCDRQANCDLTIWVAWFLGMVERAFVRAKDTIDKTLLIAQFWKSHSQTELNERQRKAVRRLLESYPVEFEGGLTNRKYVNLTRTSRETAKRDLADLERKGLLRRNAGKGRSVSYSIHWPEEDRPP